MFSPLRPWRAGPAAASRAAAAALLGLMASGDAPGQVPTAYFPFDGSGADVTGQVAASYSAGSPSFTADRSGQAGSALDLRGTTRYFNVTGPTAGNSASDLGLAGAFTVAAWVRPSNPEVGNNMLVGMPGTGTGTVHYGLRTKGNGTGGAYMGMFNNDLAGFYVLEGDLWYHIVWQYTGSEQRIYINGILDSTRAAANTTKAANIRIGTSTDTSSWAFDGLVDDLAFFDTALGHGQILALAHGADPTRLGSDPGDPFPGTLGSAGNWGVRDIRNHTLAPTSLVNALAIAGNQSAGTVTGAQRARLNLTDPQTSNNPGNFGGDLTFVSNTGGDDNEIVVVAQGFIEIATEGDYTFGFGGDDGGRLRLYGQDFAGATTVAGSNGSDPPFAGDTLLFDGLTGNGSVLGSVHLTPGVYLLEHLHFENLGGAWTEVYAAPGVHTQFSGVFDLVGDTAAGGLPLVEPKPIIKFFEVSDTAIVSGSPATITFTWDQLFGATLFLTGEGNVSNQTSATVASPTSTTTYTLLAVRGGVSTSAYVTVFVDPVPAVLSFAPDDDTVASGAPVTLRWETLGGQSWSLSDNQGGGPTDVTPQTSGQIGSIVVHPTAPETTYTLTVTNVNGSSDAMTTVTIGTPPTIESFVLDDPTPPPGAVLKLTWDVTGADTLELDNGIGDVSTLPHVLVCPTVPTTYTLTATNGFGSATAQVFAEVPDAVGVDSARFAVRFVSSSTPIDSLADADALLAPGAPNVTGDVTFTDVASVNYADSGSAGEVAGDSSFPPGFNDDFVMRATATLVVNVSGTYTFAINNDDGGRLMIDGETVINDDALHGPTTSETTVDLAGGNHTIDYIFFERSGGAAGELFLRTGAAEAVLLQETSGLTPIVLPTVVISEIMADNDGDVLEDGDGDASDWIELFNGTGAPVDLSGWYLTDDPLVLTKWAFPAGTTIADDGYLIIFASDKAAAPPAGELHTNFRLGAEGEYLALVAPDGTTVVDALEPTAPPQEEGVSWGRFDTDQREGYFLTPTPGGRNPFGYEGLVGDTSFNIDRGLHETPFLLEITTSTPGATILYTLDGSEPTDKDGTHGATYTGPVPIDATTVVRARAVRAGWFPSNIDTQTYIFLDDVIVQDANHAVGIGFPPGSVNGQSFAYGMNPSVVSGNPEAVKDALRAIPTFSLVMDQEDFSDPVGGIYVNASSRGLERPGSLELINEDGVGSGQFQVDLGVRIRGGFSRSGGNPKHAFRFFFRSRYGPGRFDYPLFQDEGVDEFDGFDLRTAQNYSWSFQNSSMNTFLRDVFGRDAQREMGQPYTRSRYYHLYINGHYWGLFQTQERAEADYGETYFGGGEDDYDTVKSAGNAGGYTTEVTDGDFGEWTELWNGVRALGTAPTPSVADYFALQGLAPDGVTPTAGPVLLDAENLIDYMLAVFYTGAFDTALSTFLDNASNNWFALRNRVSDDRGFAFFFHDGEHGMGTDRTSGGGTDKGLPQNRRSSDRTGPWGEGLTNYSVSNWKGHAMYGTIGQFNRSNPQYLHEDLAHVAEYRLRFADRAYRHLVRPGGALTVDSAKALVADRAATVATAILAESARWGNTSNQSVSAWQAERNFLDDWIEAGGNEFLAAGSPPGRAAAIVAQLRAYRDASGAAAPLYPSNNPPTFSQEGGFVPAGFTLTMGNPNGNGTVYYTLDGSDPRAVGGALGGAAQAYGGPVVLNASTAVNARVRSSVGEWSALHEAVFIVGQVASAANLAVTEIHYHPALPTPSELAQPFVTEDNDFEFIEVMNVSGADTIDLSEVAFTAGIAVTVPLGTTLEPGERAVFVTNPEAFSFRYAALDPAPRVLGAYIGRLDNGGENLALTAANGTTIAAFPYNDNDPWPESADGDGYSLTLRCPEGTRDPADPASWSTSMAVHGTPGYDDCQSYDEWAAANGATAGPEDDDDGDGCTNYQEYLLGTNPTVSSPCTPDVALDVFPDGTGGDAVYATITFVRALGTEGTIRAEVSSDLATWDDTSLLVVAVVNLGDGTEQVTVRTTVPVGSGNPRTYLRLHFSNN